MLEKMETLVKREYAFGNMPSNSNVSIFYFSRFYNIILTTSIFEKMETFIN